MFGYERLKGLCVAEVGTINNLVTKKKKLNNNIIKFNK